MKTIYDFTACGCPAAITEVAPTGMVSLEEAVITEKAVLMDAGTDEEILKVTDGAVCGMAAEIAK